MKNTIRSIIFFIASVLAWQAHSLPVDQCDTTQQCRAEFGSGATDCFDSRSNTSVCLCGDTPCAVATPVPTPRPPVSNPIVDQCDTTQECKSIFGPRATDCLNSQSNSSVCMCGSSQCSQPTPTAAPTRTPVPTAVPTPAPTSNPQPVDQCNTTQECKSLFGQSATDCRDSRSNTSICMCGSERCDGSLPNPTLPPPPPTPQPTAPPTNGDACEVLGTAQQWHRVEIRCKGYAASESDDETFTDHRMNVTFSQGGRRLVVPGHFAADGNAANSSANSGDVWRAYFMPPTTGNWSYEVSLRRGNDIAGSANANAGSAVSPINDTAGTFRVNASGANGDDMRAKGLLVHKAGERYLRHAGDNSVYISGGMDSPENIFGYNEFDNTRKFSNVSSCKGILHEFEPHARDFNNGDPTWRNGRGKNLIGLVNYIAENGVNAAYIMMMTVNSDGCDAHPWVEYSGNRRAFDVSKLDQWEIVLSHMTRKGIMIHAMTQETENDQLLNRGNLGLERKIYYRELISRFGHHPALQWNLGEENSNTPAQQRQFSNYIRSLDPYDHPIMMHTYPNEQDKYEDLLGHQTFNGPTLQFGNIPNNASSRSSVYGTTLDWINRSNSAGRSWVVTVTEASGRDAPTPNTQVSRLQRSYWMWANVMAGGGGFEWYLKNAGSGHAYDLAVENLREFDNFWKQSGYLVDFFRGVLQGELALDLQSLTPANNVTSTGSDWVLADPGRAYVIYLRDGGNTDINLPDNRDYRTIWFNPRTGQRSNGDTLSGPGNRSIGNPPSQSNQDWAVVVVAENGGGNGNTHPDIVRVIDIPDSDILSSPRAGWKDSYSVGDRCYCDTTFDHDIGGVMVNTPEGTMTVRQACERAGSGPGAAGRPIYNDVQCGNGPANDAGDEDYCPGRVDIGKAGCGHIGPNWTLSSSSADYQQENGLVIMEAENTNSDLGLWDTISDVGGFTGSGAIEFGGNTPLNGPARSPLKYTFTINQSGLHYLHLRAAKEHITIDGELRTDVANDAYVRLEGNYEAGPNVGNSHQDDAPLSALKSDTKFFGGNNNSFAWASGARLDLGGENNKRVAIYNLRAGETYTLVISGRSKFFKIDRIVFRHESVSAGAAQNTSRGETR